MNAPLPPEAVAVASLPIAEILASPSNPRKHFDTTYIDELAASIKAHGLIQPITVRPLPLEAFMAHNQRRKAGDETHPQYEIVVGECRMRAAKQAGLIEIPAFWRELDDKQVLEIQIIENLNRRDVHPIEEAEGYEQLIQRHGYSADEIAAKIGKSKGYVYARLKLTALRETAREAFFAGQLEASTALLIARIPGATLQKRAVEEVTKGYDGQPLTYRNAKNHLQRHFTIPLENATFKLDDATLLPAAGSCAACPKRSGNCPEICADLDDADVCTDTACFEEKRLARRDQLVAIAEKKGVKVILGEAAAEFMPHGPHFLNSSQYVSLQDKVPGDSQHRTYRDILGDDAPVSHLVEDHNNHLVPLGEPTALAKALRKAGWQPDLLVSSEQSENNAQREQAHAEREAKLAAGKIENERRAALAATLIERARTTYDAGEANPDQLIKLLAVAWVRFDASFNGAPDEPRLARFGITLPEEAEGDEYQVLAQVTFAMQQWSPGTALAYILDVLTSEECTAATNYHYDPARDLPCTLNDLAALLPAETALYPTQAAQAPDTGAAKPKGKKAKAKADPAPALPANEPAAPVKPLDAWPFPTAAEAA
jgi:ParB/RepB/Spo0J family partition protein